MKIIQHPDSSGWEELLKRPAVDALSLEKSVKKILRQVKLKGDTAVRKYTAMFDGVKQRKLEISPKEISAAENNLPATLKNAITLAAKNIRAFHEPQWILEKVIETMPGIICYRKSVPIEKVGLYIPGGTAPLFSTILMLGIPASIAGCREIILCSPPQKNGELHPAILFTAKLVGITRIFKAGGVQAIGAMAYGTSTIPKVDKIFGPGNQYVMAAKQLIQQEGMAIDMPAGPSELCVVADHTARASFVAADLLSQAEHGADSQVMLVTTSASLANAVIRELAEQLEKLPRKDIAAKALENSRAIILSSMKEVMEIVNAYAPEHLILACENPELIANMVINAGSVFLGHYTPESAGDYASGTNHTLPTNGYARSYSGVSVDSFVKKITFQQLTPEGLGQISETIVTMAKHEGLDAHAEAVRIRMGGN
jgi:histidinol dehydrogenase